MKLLLSHGADPTAEIGEKTPLEFAMANGQIEIHAFLESEFACYELVGNYSLYAQVARY